MPETPEGPRFRAPGGDWSLLTIVLGVVGAIVALGIVFRASRDQPFDPDCGGFVPNGHDEEVDAYRSGAILMHIAFAVLIAAGLAWSSLQREYGKRGRLRVGALTLAGLAVLTVFVLASLVNHDTFLVLGLPAIGLVALPTIPLSGFLSVLICALALAIPGTPERRGRRAIECAGWLTLLIWLPASIVDIYIQGEGPFLC